MKFQQIIFALNRIIQVLISLEFTLLNIIPKSLVTLQFLKFLIVQIKAYIQGFQMRYQSFLGHWYPNSYSWFSDSMDILFVPITTVQWLSELIECGNLQIGKPAVALWIPMTQTWLIPHLKVLNVGFNLRYQTLQKL